jgi:hypothetical protein
MREALARIRAEYLEMPGMRLTEPQVARLCGYAPALCHAALDALVQEAFLCVKPDGTYARTADGVATLRPRPLKAYDRAAVRIPAAS